jgi:NAD(P)-dependent dehydrogenase (short-subunit alcohol dehydrogenase family)
MVDAALGKFGRIDILVNCAGVIKTSSALDLDEENWDETVNVNARGALFCAKHVAQHMIEEGIQGRIITIASQAGKRGEFYNCAYCASKAAAISITQTLALELAPYKITVNAVCPGVVETQMMRDVIADRAPLYGVTPEVYRENFLKEIPMGRIEQPEDVAKAVVFLASEYADYITGQALNVTGGMIFH